MCATVPYRKLIGGRLYPKAARTGPYFYAEEVSRVNGKLFSKYIGIVRTNEEDVIERGGEEEDDNHKSEPA